MEIFYFISTQITTLHKEIREYITFRKRMRTFNNWWESFSSYK